MKYRLLWIALFDHPTHVYTKQGDMHAFGRSYDTIEEAISDASIFNRTKNNVLRYFVEREDALHLYPQLKIRNPNA